MGAGEPRDAASAEKPSRGEVQSAAFGAFRQLSATYGGYAKTVQNLQVADIAVVFRARCYRDGREFDSLSRAIQAGSRKRDPALFNSGLGERSPGPLRFSPTFPRPSTLGEHDARVDSVRAESAAGVKERVTRARGTAFALSHLASGERGTESV